MYDPGFEKTDKIKLLKEKLKTNKDLSRSRKVAKLLDP